MLGLIYVSRFTLTFSLSLYEPATFEIKFERRRVKFGLEMSKIGNNGSNHKYSHTTTYRYLFHPLRKLTIGKESRHEILVVLSIADDLSKTEVRQGMI